MKGLIDLQHHLKLREEDVAPVERRFLNGCSLTEYKIKQDKSAFDLLIPLPLTSKEMSEGSTKDILLDDSQKITVKIPVGVKDGQKLRIKGKGQINPSTQDRGDLYLVIQLQKILIDSQRKAEVNQQNQEDDLSSDRFGRYYYAKLRDLLAIKNWEAADQETTDRIFDLTNCSEKEKSRYLRELPTEEVINLPWLDLHNIDELWMKYSLRHFGFTPQKEIWKKCGSPRNYNKDWERFGVEVGWRSKGVLGIGGEWLFSSDLTFDISAPKGHLPTVARIYDTPPVPVYSYKVFDSSQNYYRRDSPANIFIIFSRVGDDKN